MADVRQLDQFGSGDQRRGFPPRLRVLSGLVQQFLRQPLQLNRAAGYGFVPALVSVVSSPAQLRR